MKKDIDCNFVEENEEDDDMESWNNNGQNMIRNYFQKNYYELCMELQDEDDPLFAFGETFKNQDEFYYFQQLLENVQKMDNNLYQKFCENLTPSEMHNLQELVHVRNVSVQYNNTLINVPRRTIKIKRKNQD